MFNGRAAHFTLLVLISIFCLSLAGCGDGSDTDDGAATPTPAATASSQSGGTQPGASPAASNAAAPKAGAGSELKPELTRAPANYEGNLDAANCQGIVGWAWDKNQPNAPLRLDIYDLETKVDTVTASAVRDDLVTAHKGNGAHGFTIPTPARLKDGKPHYIWLAFTGTNFHLNKGGPITVTCPAG
jgi:hypothetical protein